MDKRLNKVDFPKWLTAELQARVRSLYEPRYKRHLTEEEVITIALNLTSLIEHFLKFKRRTEYGI